MTVTKAVQWFVTQNHATLNNPRSRTYLLELLNDPVIAEAKLRFWQRLRIANAMEVSLIETITTDYTEILARLPVNWNSRLERNYLTQIVALTGLSLPYSLDFSTLPDGALPAVFTAPTWTIASGKAKFTEVFGPELLTDPGLEAAYTAGLCATLTKTGSPTLAESVDTHGGTKAQAFTGVAGGNALDYAAVAPAKHSLYQFSAWGKYPGGSGSSVGIRLIQSGSVLGAEQAVNYVITPASYAQFKVSLLANSTNTLLPRIAREESGAFNPIILDDGSLKAITSSPFALVDAGQANINARVKPPGDYAAFIDGTWLGLVARANTTSDPVNYIMAVIHQRQNGAGSSFGLVSLFKRVGETYTTLVSDTLVTLVSDAELEIRCNGTTVSVWYNSLQVSTDKTVSDAELVDNTYFGMYSAGGNFAQSFFLEAA